MLVSGYNQVLMNYAFLLIPVTLVTCTTIANHLFRKREKKESVRESDQEVIAHFLLFVVLITYPLILLEILTGTLQEAPELTVLNILTQFLGTIISIFFTLGVIPLEKIINSTTYSLTKRFLRNRVYSKALVTFCLIFLFGVLQTVLGVNDFINLIFIFYLLISFGFFFLLIFESIRLINVMNVIKDLEEDAITLFDNFIKPVANRFTDFKTQLGAMMQVKEHLVRNTKLFIEPIFITTKKHIKDDQPEVVNAGVNAMTNIAIKYFETYQYSVTDTDELVVYITERYEDLLKSLSDTSHYAISTYFITSLERLALETLKITTPLSQHGSSFFAISIPSFIKEIVLSKELVKNTSAAPIVGVEALERIIRVAVQQEKYHVVLTCLDYLVDISVMCTKLNFLYANHVAKRANQAIISLHFDILRDLSGYSYLPDSLSETIEKPLQAFIEVGQDSLRKENVSPFIGSRVDLASIGDPYLMLTQRLSSLSYLVFSLLQDTSENKVSQHLLTEYLDEIFTMLNQQLMKAHEKKLTHLSVQISQTARDIAFLLFEFVWDGKLEKNRELQKLINERVYYIFLNSIQNRMEVSRDHNVIELLDDCISIIGIYLIVFETWQGLPDEMINDLNEYLDKLLPTGQIQHQGKYYPDYAILNKISYVKRYLYLILLWETNLLGNPKTRIRLLKLLYLKIRRGTWIDRRDRDKLLPDSMMGMRSGWFLSQPMVAYLVQPFRDFGTLLNVDSVGTKALSVVITEARVRSDLILVLEQIAFLKRK